MPNQTEGSLLLPLQVKNNSIDQGLVPGTDISLNLHSPTLEHSQYITLSNIGQHSTRMQCFFP